MTFVTCNWTQTFDISKPRKLRSSVCYQLVAQSQRLIDPKPLGDHQEPISKTDWFVILDDIKSVY